MESPQVADTFIALLEKSGLLPIDEIAAAVARFALPPDAPAKDLARAFLNAKLITRFQAERLLEGKFRGFFIDHYKVLDILGAGGMACLYLAENRNSGERVALKVISDKHKTDAGMLTRLKIEARAGKKLKHPAVIRTFDIHTTDDVFGETMYLVMEFVAGVNLEELVNLKGPIPPAHAADFVRQTAEGLQHAHAAGLVHRDVKPGNLLVDAKGAIKILDFGLALLDARKDEDADEFSLAMIFGHNCLGTADYIAPEQSVDSFAIDRRADIYSLGCTLYVALSGKLPYPMASSMDKLEGHRSRPAPPICEVAKNIPAGLGSVVAKMMAKRPDDRYQTMAEVAVALQPFAKRQPVDFDFPKVLAWRAKLARRRFAGQYRTADSSRAGSSITSAPSKPSLHSASTKRLPQATATDTAVTPALRKDPQIVSLGAPFAGTSAEASLSRPDLTPGTGISGPALVPLNGAPVVPLLKNLIVIGRDPDCDIQIASGMVSGKHCELHFDGTQWRVLDLGSKNGIQVNGRAASDQLLISGDRISLACQHHFRIDYLIEAPSISPRTARWAVYSVAAAALAAAGLYGVAAWLMK
ncbi:MAG TPA: FHA domain-containing serine/threonine-protein kinase [Planctomycetaceae bacterium]|jgi:serine/threonine protein kinase